MIRHLSYLLLAIALLQSCNLLPGRKKEGGVVARVFDKSLFESELNGLVPSGTSPKDSAEITRNYINNWVRQELLLHQAESNLSDDQMNFDEQVEQYRNSLIIFQYESELVRQKLDTNITDQEIREYYEKNQDNFLLHENILRASIITVSKNSPLTARFRQLIRSDKEADKDKLVALCQQYAASYHLDDQAWLPFIEFAGKVPVSTSNETDFLEKNPYFEVQDSTFHYLVRIKEYKIKESTSPLSFETANIKAIILNKRKSTLLSQMEEDLYKSAIRRKNVEIYNSRKPQ